MIELGKIQKLEVIKLATVGAYLNTRNNQKQENVLLPKKQVPMDVAIGDEIEVFVYRDSSDRIISTINKPKMVMGEIKKLKVVEVSDIGAFLNWGLEKDLFIPFKEQTQRLQKGYECLVGLYIDKSDRICATMNIYDMLSNESPYKVDDKVKGIIFSINKDMGAFVAIDKKYQGLIPIKELYSDHKYGDEIEARVTKVREDGKLDLSLREKSYMQMDKDADKIYERLIKSGGYLPYNDKTPASKIYAEFDMSKNGFKTAIGRLLKAKKICFVKDGIQKL
ncbi:MAG: RNA-binding protein [Firmicutes bacterium HGW-Firmicutes-7]|nr:MAG: RNA-binding protein [Firmicutes bacterium HGW-Firmicutes-7]